MKKLIFASAFTLSFAAFGALEKVATIQLADTDTLVKGISKLGEFTGNQMLGIMASQSVMNLPWAQRFGAARSGEASAFIVYLDGDDAEAAMLYPATMTAAAFKQANPKAIEKDGVISIESDDDDDDLPSMASGSFLPDDYCVAFSKDGKWLAWAEKAAVAKAALAEVKFAEKKMDGDLLKLMLPESGIRSITKMMEKELAKNDKLDDADAKRLIELMKQIALCGLGVRVNDLGLDFRGVVKPTAGSDLAKIGNTAITSEAWSTVDPAAVVFGLCAANSGRKNIEFSAVKSILEKHGFKLDFLTEKVLSKGYSTFTIDIPAVETYVKSLKDKQDKLPDCEKLVEELSALTELPDGKLFPLESEPMGASLLVKGFKPVANAKDRFETTLPEVKTKPCANVGFFAGYSIFKALNPIILGNLDADERAMLEPLFLTLPAEGKTGTAWAVWSEKGAMRYIFRVGADEFKGISAGFTAFSAMSMQKMQKAQNQIKLEEVRQ